MVMRACLSCGEPTKATRCPPCASERNVERGSSHQRGYGSRWRRLSERYRRIVPYCELHLPGCQRIAIDVDHKRPLRAAGRSTWSNAQSTCRSCHRIKTARDLEEYPIHA